MPNSDVVASELLAGRTAVIDGSAPVPASSGVVSVSGELRRLSDRASRAAPARLGDAQLAWLVSVVLFVACAWPLGLTEVPPYQDLPNHLAAVTVIEHPQRYPEFIFNGFLKTNAALFAWLYVVGKVAGAKLAARLFALLVLAANAVVLPRFVLSLTRSRGRMIVASLFAWPMVHNWFVSMGMLDFALAFPLSLVLLLALHRQQRTPTIANAALVVVLGAVTWYAHVFPLFVVHLLVGLEVVRLAVQRTTWKDRLEAARPMLLPLAPVTLLVAVSLYQHLSDTVGPMTGFIDHRSLLPPWELAYNMWSEWFWGFSKLTITSLVPCIGLAVIGVWRRKEAPPFFSPLALVALCILYCFLPYIVTNWFHVNSRIIPYIWMACLLRVPDQVPKKVTALLGVSAVLYSLGMGADFVRLERERKEFAAGINVVPEGARLLPLLFSHKASSDNTRNIMHFWGYYVTDKLTAAPLLFAHSHSFPVMYSSPPPVRFNHLVLEGFAPSMARSASVCRGMLDGNIVVDDCDAQYRATWGAFWKDAMPRYDHLLVWSVTPEARANIPPDYKLKFEQGRLQIFARDDGSGGERALAP